MFCKRCGSEAHTNALYCQNDGTSLTDNKDTFTLQKVHNRFCSQCSCENTTNSLYCINCGVTLSKISEKTASNVEGPAVLRGSSLPIHPSVGLFSNLLTKRSAGYAGLAIVITFLLSWITSIILNGKLQDLFASEWTFNMIKDFKFISSTDIMMLSHMIGINYTGSISILEGSLKISGGLFILLLIPLLSLTLAGYLSNRTEPQRSAVERLIKVAPIAVIYAVLMAFISLFAGVSVNTADISILDEGMVLKTSYGFMPALLHSLILGFIFTTLGSFIGMSKSAKQKGSNISYGISIQRAVFSAVAGIMICMLIATSVINLKPEFSEDEVPGAVKAAISTQVGGYYWGLTHFNTLSMEMVNPDGDKEEITYSIIGGLRDDSREFDLDEMESVIGGMWYLLLIPLLLHIWTGRQLLRAQTNRFMYELAVYAMSFGVISAFFAYMSKLRIHSNLDENIEVHFGFSFIGTFLLSAIVAFVLAYIGVMIFNRTAITSVNGQQAKMRMEE